MSRYWRFIGECSNVFVMSCGKPKTGWIEAGTPEDQILHDKARALDAEDYLIDWAHELNDDYFDGKLAFQTVEFSHKMTAHGGKCCYQRPAVIRISYTLAFHAYTDTEVCVEYLLAHELSHIPSGNHNHGYDFWQTVRKNPNAEHGHELYHGSDMPIYGGTYDKRAIRT